MAPTGKKKQKSGDSQDRSRQEDEEVVAPVNQNVNLLNGRDIPHVIEMLAKLTVDLCENQITYDLLKLRLINSVWKEEVDRYLRNTADNSLTIEVRFSAPPVQEMIPEKILAVNKLQDDTFASLMHIRDVAAHLARFSTTEPEEVVYEVKGSRIEVHFEKINSLIELIESLIRNAPIDCNNAPGTMNQTTLSLAFIDPYRNWREEASLKSWIMEKKKYQPLIDLEKLFPKLAALHLTTALAVQFWRDDIRMRANDTTATSYPFYEELVASVASANHREGGPLRSLDFNFLHYTKPVESSPLRRLLPQLEHLGLNYKLKVENGQQEEPLFSPATTTTTKTTNLRSLKCQLRNGNFQPASKHLFGNKGDAAAAAVFGQLTSLEMNTDSFDDAAILQRSCTALNSLKIYLFESDTKYTFGYRRYNFGFFTPMSQSLQQLTLVNFDMPSWFIIESAKGEVEFPQVTTLTLVSWWPILEGFRTNKRDRNGNLVRKVDVPIFVQMLGAIFPALQSLNLMGSDPLDADDVRGQLEHLLTEQQQRVVLHWH